MREKGKYFNELSEEERHTYAMYCRHAMIHKLLADIRADLEVCEMEGWPKREYIDLIKRSLPI
jgi:hypothetical protein